MTEFDSFLKKKIFAPLMFRLVLGKETIHPYLRQSGSTADAALPIDSAVDCGSTRRVVVPGLVVV